MLVFFYILLYTHEKNYFKLYAKKMEITAFIYILFSDLVYFYALVKNVYYPSIFLKLTPLAFLLIAFSLEEEYVEKVRKSESSGDANDKYMMIILMGMGIVSFAINPDVLRGLLFLVMISFRIISEKYTQNYEISEYLVRECVQKNKDLKEKALYLGKMSSELENRIIQRTKELDNINRDLFVVVYRPQLEINSKTIRTIEASVRWDSNLIGSIKESEFLSIAEENGLVIELDKLILEESLKRIKYINKNYDTDMAVAVNISPRHFMEPKFVIRLEEKIKNYIRLQT